MSIIAPQIPTMGIGETRNGKASFVGRLDTDEELTGTPTVTEVSTSDLTISSAAVSSDELVINSATVPAGKAVEFRVASDGSMTAGRRYQLLITCGTNASPAQTLVGRVFLDAVA